MTIQQKRPSESDIDFFRRLTLSICSSLDLDKALERCLETLQGRIPAEDIFLILDAPWLGGFYVLAQATVPGVPRLDKNIPLPPEILDSVYKNPILEPILVNDTSKHPNCMAVASYVKNQGFSEILHPIVLKEVRKGLLVIRTRGNGRYTEEHLQLISRVHGPFTMAVSNAVQHMEVLRLKEQLRDENRYLKEELFPHREGVVIGESAGLKDVMTAVGQIAPLNNTVLLLGETGVGKEVIAGSIHKRSPREKGPFIKVNCGAIPENLIDSELFGHVRGAFSGATEKRKGRFERAAGGTLFLDEIGELPLQVQTRLLRAIQTKEIEPVGGSGPVPVDIRIIAATHRNLEQMVERGEFREDLWFRINAFPILIPPLRERTEDIPELVRFFVSQKGKELGLRLHPPLSQAATNRLIAMTWPGNIRELENLVEQELIRNRGKELHFNIPPGPKSVSVPNYPATDNLPTQSASPPSPLEEALSLHIRRALKQSSGQVHGPEGAARLLQINASTLRHRMSKMGIAHGRKY